MHPPRLPLLLVLTAMAGYGNPTRAESAARLSSTPQAPAVSPYNPGWENVAPTRTRMFVFDNGRTPVENGAALKTALQGLKPGDRLEIGAGTYSVDSYFALDLQGAADAPIWVVGAPGAAVVLTRPDAQQNLLNVGVAAQARYVCFRGLEFTGGSLGIRFHDCTQVWLDQCRVHHTGDAAISTNTRDTSFMFITRNEIWSTRGTGEGMYLGANHGAVIMSQSVIALNHVHDTNQGVTQGDGIELKQGSWGNWIAENLVHDCNYPCILVYGTAGRPANLVERNVCYRSGDNALQVQGECIVRNNLVIAAAGSAFASQPHQGHPTRLTVVHNTFINGGRAARLNSWGVGAAMVFANNACYSHSSQALEAVNGFTGVTFAGNVVFGSLTPGIPGTAPGAGLEDFVDVTWDGSRRDAVPSAGSRLRGAAEAAHATPADRTGRARVAPHTAGAYGG